VRIRRVGPHEHELHEALGALTVAAFMTLHPEFVEDGYGEELADVAGRIANGVVLAALSDDDALLGSVTYVPDRSSPLAAFDAEHAASIRMLAVDPRAQRAGVGEALVRACIARATAEGCTEVLLHSTRAMTTARRLYARLGFRRDETLDVWPEPDFHLLGYRLTLGRCC
jgi:ribosomal protein S18 acetylase RimI-like enzyme